MKRQVRLTFQKGDFLAVGLVIMLAVVLILGYLPEGSTSEQVMVQVYQDGQLIREMPLQNAEETSMLVSGSYHNQVTIRDGKVSITESDCPGADCVYSGWISQPGRSIVCLPNRVEIRITGASDVDFVVR